MKSSKHSGTDVVFYKQEVKNVGVCLKNVITFHLIYLKTCTLQFLDIQDYSKVIKFF